jgi:hypothetical protein
MYSSWQEEIPAMNPRSYCKLAVLLSLLALVAAWAGSDRFAADFTDRTMRVDYFHSGDASEEHISLDQVVSDGPWPGSRTQLLDELNLGKYFFEVVDRETNRVLYSRGFSSIYGEWETTPEGRAERLP